MNTSPAAAKRHPPMASCIEHCFPVQIVVAVVRVLSSLCCCCYLAAARHCKTEVFPILRKVHLIPRCLVSNPLKGWPAGGKAGMRGMRLSAQERLPHTMGTTGGSSIQPQTPILRYTPPAICLKHRQHGGKSAMSVCQPASASSTQFCGRLINFLPSLWEWALSPVWCTNQHRFLITRLLQHLPATLVAGKSLTDALLPTHPTPNLQAAPVTTRRCHLCLAELSAYLGNMDSGTSQRATPAGLIFTRRRVELSKRT